MILDKCQNFEAIYHFIPLLHLKRIHQMLELLLGWQKLGVLLRQASRVSGYTHRLVIVIQGILNHNLIGLLAEQNTDGWIVRLVFDLPVYGRDVETKLASVF